MGSTQAIDMANQVALENIKLEQAIIWHLTGNHYPPIPTTMVAPCIRAINYANRGEWNKQVRLPRGVTFRGKTLAPVTAMIEQHHLESFLDQEEEENE